MLSLEEFFFRRASVNTTFMERRQLVLSPQFQPQTRAKKRCNKFSSHGVEDGSDETATIRAVPLLLVGRLVARRSTR